MLGVHLQDPHDCPVTAIGRGEGTGIAAGGGFLGSTLV